MGGGSFSSKSYADAATDRAKKGIDDFAYSHDVSSGRAHGVHPTLDTLKMTINPKTGKGFRESRDSKEHPLSKPIMIFFDHTGSMGELPEKFQKHLVTVMDVVIAKGKLADPQILVGAIGDSFADRYPFQAGQFESDNRFDEQLRNIVIEHGGGGQDMESYNLAFYFAAYHTETDAWEKRGQKGYLFTIGDEKPWPKVTKDEARQLFGVTAEKDETVEDLIALAQEKWELFHIIPQTSTGRDKGIQKRWADLLGERRVLLDNTDILPETIASLVFALETASSVDSVVDATGLKGDRATSLKNALVPVLASRVPSHLATGNLPSTHKKGKGGVSRI